MTDVPDLSVYRYGREKEFAGALNVGWLSRWHRLTRGRSPKGFSDALLGMHFRPANVFHAGFHCCPFCPLFGIVQMRCLVKEDGIHTHLGSGILSVTHRDGTVFVCPDLIYHYVKKHRYLPPQKFVEAVMQWKETDYEHVMKTVRGS